MFTMKRLLLASTVATLAMLLLVHVLLAPRPPTITAIHYHRSPEPPPPPPKMITLNVSIGAAHVAKLNKRDYDASTFGQSSKYPATPYPQSFAIKIVALHLARQQDVTKVDLVSNLWTHPDCKNNAETCDVGGVNQQTTGPMAHGAVTIRNTVGASSWLELPATTVGTVSSAYFGSATSRAITSADYSWLRIDFCKNDQSTVTGGVDNLKVTWQDGSSDQFKLDGSQCMLALKVPTATYNNAGAFQVVLIYDLTGSVGQKNSADRYCSSRQPSLCFRMPRFTVQLYSTSAIATTSLSGTVYDDSQNYDGQFRSDQDTTVGAGATVALVRGDLLARTALTTTTDSNGRYAFSFSNPSTSSTELKLLSYPLTSIFANDRYEYALLVSLATAQSNKYRQYKLYQPTRSGGYGSLFIGTNYFTATDKAEAALVYVPRSPASPTVDIGFVLRRKVGQFVWFDPDDNGRKGPAELPLTGVQVFLYRRTSSSQTLLGSTYTDAQGAYAFWTTDYDFQIPSTYVVQVSKSDAKLIDPQSGRPLTISSGGPQTTDASGNQGYVSASDLMYEAKYVLTQLVDPQLIQLNLGFSFYQCTDYGLNQCSGHGTCAPCDHQECLSAAEKVYCDCDAGYQSAKDCSVADQPDQPNATTTTHTPLVNKVNESTPCENIKDSNAAQAEYDCESCHCYWSTSLGATGLCFGKTKAAASQVPHEQWPPVDLCTFDLNATTQPPTPQPPSPPPTPSNGSDANQTTTTLARYVEPTPPPGFFPRFEAAVSFSKREPLIAGSIAAAYVCCCMVLPTMIYVHHRRKKKKKKQKNQQSESSGDDNSNDLFSPPPPPPPFLSKSKSNSVSRRTTSSRTAHYSKRPSVRSRRYSNRTGANVFAAPPPPTTSNLFGASSPSSAPPPQPTSYYSPPQSDFQLHQQQPHVAPPSLPVGMGGNNRGRGGGGGGGGGRGVGAGGVGAGRGGPRGGFGFGANASTMLQRGRGMGFPNRGGRGQFGPAAPRGGGFGQAPPPPTPPPPSFF